MKKALSGHAGFTLVEVVIALLISAIIFSGAMIAYQYSIRAFHEAASISDAVETKTSLTELVYRYFERWGVGVVSRSPEEDGLASCTGKVFAGDSGPDVCPSHRRHLNISAGSAGCTHSVSFYGTIYGTGIVREIEDDKARLVSCRLDNSIPARENCFLVSRGLQIQNPVDHARRNLVPFGFSTSRDSALRPHNEPCSDRIDKQDVSAGKTLACARLPNASGVCSEERPSFVLQEGDLILRAPHHISLYCAPSERDRRQTWLYVNLTDTARDCTAVDAPPMPLAPVKEFKVTGLPDGCNGLTGECTAVRVMITFESRAPRYESRQLDTFTIERVFGR